MCSVSQSFKEKFRNTCWINKWSAVVLLVRHSLWRHKRETNDTPGLRTWADFILQARAADNEGWSLNWALSGEVTPGQKRAEATSGLRGPGSRLRRCTRCSHGAGGSCRWCCQMAQEDLRQERRLVQALCVGETYSEHIEWGKSFVRTLPAIHV